MPSSFPTLRKLILEAGAVDPTDVDSASDTDTDQKQADAHGVDALYQEVTKTVDALESAGQAFAAAHAKWVQAGGEDPQAAGKDPKTRRKEIAGAAVMRGFKAASVG